MLPLSYLSNLSILRFVKASIRWTCFIADDLRERKPRPHFKFSSHKVGESSFTLTVFSRGGGLTSLSDFVDHIVLFNALGKGSLYLSVVVH